MNVPSNEPTQSEADGPAWPSGRGRRDGIVLQFGESRADLLHHALVTGDPLADAVAEAIQAEGSEVRAQWDRASADGLAAVPDAHPAIAALLSHAESLPTYATDDILDFASEPFFSAPNAVHLITLSAGSLIRVYQSPSIAEVLTTTGRLIDGADRRLQETSKWLSTAMLPGSMRPGKPGFTATLQVRLLHAHMRQVARRRDFDEGTFGAPINQVDLARTWMDFTLTSFSAQAAMGFGLTSSELDQLYQYWWVVGHVMGIEPELIAGVQDNAQAHRADELYQAVTGPLIPESKELAAITLKSITTMLSQQLRVPGPIGAFVLNDLARRFHPKPIAEELGLSVNPLAAGVVNLAIGVFDTRRVRQRKDSDGWAERIAANRRAAASYVGDSDAALYETPGSAQEAHA